MASAAKLYVNLRALRANYARLQAALGGAECAAVVKANAYGLGIEPVALALNEQKCKSYFVANLDEALELRGILPEAEIFVFHGVMENEVEEFKAHSITPVLNNPEQLQIWPQELPAAAHFDTGMTRLGFDPIDAELISGYNITLLMSHLACAETKQNQKNYQQLYTFDAVAKRYPSIRRSLCNSYGIYLGKQFHASLARPGIALYGGNPTPQMKNNMEQVARITAPIIQINHVNEQKTVGYGATYSANPGQTIVTVPVGYADGYMRKLSNRGRAYIQGHELPLVGRISMDLITFDATGLPENFLKIGQELELVNKKYTISEIAKNAGTIEYEFLTGLGNRFKRVYHE